MTRQRRVAGQEPGHQQRGHPVAALDAVAAEHRVHEQPRELGLPADLGERAAPPAAGLGGRVGGDGGVEPRVVEDLRHAAQRTPAAGSAMMRRMDLAPSERAAALRDDLLAFMDSHVYPAEADVRAPDHRGRRSAPAAAGRRGAQGRGAQARAVEPVPARRELGRGADQPRLRAHRRDHRPQPRPRARGDQLRRAGHREHGGADDVRHPRAAGAVAGAAARGRDPLLLRDDRAGGGLRATRATSRARSRREGDEYVVDARKWFITGAADARCKVAIVMGDLRSRRARARAALDGAGADGRAGRDGRAQHGGVRLHRPARPLRDQLRGRARAGLQPRRRGGRRVRDRPGAARPGAHPPLHARDRHGRAGARAAGGPRALARGVRRAAVRPGARAAPRSPSRACRSTRRACSCSRPRT